MMTETEIKLAHKCIAMAKESGADKARVTVSINEMDLVATLDGNIDKVTHSLDKSIDIAIFADGRYGAFSTNTLEEDKLREFISKAVSTVRILAEDPARDLPAPERVAKTAVTGDELDLYDSTREGITPEQRKKTALDAAIFGKDTGIDGCRIVSEEGEYSDSVFETLVVDSNGCFCRHRETTFDYGVEITIQDKKGNRYSGYWWDSNARLAGLDIAACGPAALRYALDQIGQKPAPGGKYNMVVESDVASKLVKPLLNALGGYALQQGNSFLKDSLGQKLFPEGLTITDEPHRNREIGSRLFDSEGVASHDCAIIENGVIKQYFINTFISGKLGIAPTIEEAIRPVVKPWPEEGLDKDAIMKMCSKGILVTGFNGGNYSLATGDFSFGVEGLLFRNGKVVRPVSEMLITGNILTLWNGLIACGSDARTCMSKLIPTLAFSNVDFSG